MIDRRNVEFGRASVGSSVRRGALACVLSSALALPDGGHDGSSSPANRTLHPQRVDRTVAVVDGYDLRFRRLTAEGLSRTRVEQIVQDDPGFMWFGTQRGLYRYDGHELRVFRYDGRRQQNALRGVYVYSLLRGRGNALWVGSDGFLDTVDPRSEAITPYDVKPENGSSGPTNISCMSQDSSGVLWLCTRSGLYRLDPATQRTIVLHHRPGDPSSIASDEILSVGEDRRGDLWVGTTAGFDLIDRATQQVGSHLALPESHKGMAAHEDRSGVVWLIHGPAGVLSRFDRSANTLTTLRPSSTAVDADPVVFSAMLEDRDGTMWFGTLNHGILKFDRGSQRFIRHISDPSNPHSLSDRRVNTLYQDREGLIWAGLHQSEPNYFLPSPPAFQGIVVAGGHSTLVSALVQERSGYIWLGLDRGVRRLDRATWTYHDVPGLARLETTSVVESAPGIFWVGTAGDGLRRVDQRTGEVTVFRHEPERAASLPSDFVEQVRLDRNGAVWAVTWRGLARWEPDAARFTTLLPSGTPPEVTFHTATFARDGVVWIGSNFGVHRVDPATQGVQWFRHAKDDVRSLSNDRVSSIHEAADGSIWIGTQIGLDHWAANARPIRRYSQEDGLPGNAVSCILEDDARHLWMSTDRGIARLNPMTGQFSQFGAADGLPGLNLTGWDSCARGRSGEMFFAGFAGAAAFHPGRIVERSYVPPVVLTRVRLLDSTVEGDGARTSSIPVGTSREIRLQSSQNKFAVEFAALSFLSPETNRFRYRLLGLQEEWIEALSDQRVATYMALPPGSYSFEVQGATIHGQWGTSPATLRIIMLPPWWRSGPFYALAVAVATGALILAYRLRVQQLTHVYNLRLEARLTERTRIARELHDTLLQGFQGLMFRLQAVREMLPSQPERAIPALETALLTSERAIDEARSAVSELRSPEKLDQNLSAGLTTLMAAAEHLSTGTEVPTWELVTSGRVREMPRAVLYELYQVVQEAIRNAFRHARAEHVTIEVRYGVDGLHLSVADDGVGVDERALSAGREAGHFGVQGMTERMERLGGTFSLQSAPANGTCVMLYVPAAVAYRKVSVSRGLRDVLRWRARSRSGNAE